MLNPTGSTTSISEASTQVRYHKAIKEISKLIGANAILRKQIQSLRQENQKLAHQCQLLASLNQQTKQDKISLLSTVEKQKREIQQKSVDLAELEKKQNEKAIQSLEQEIKAYSEQVAVLNEKLYQQGNTIIGLEQNISQLQKMNKKLGQEKDDIEKCLRKEIDLKGVVSKQCLSCNRLISRLDQNESHLKLMENQLIQIKKFHIMTGVAKGETKYRGGRDDLVSALEQRVRILQEKNKRKNIQIYKLKQSTQNLQREKQSKRKGKSFESQK